MATIIAIANASGSAGKTTTVVTLAELIGRTQRVVVVDADGQGTATCWLGFEPSDLNRTVADVLMRRATAPEALLPTTVPGVKLLPANRGLDGAALELNAQIGKEHRFRQALAAVDADVILIDCPGSVSTITIAALVAADSVLTVTQPTMKESRGVPEMLDAVQAVRDYFNPRLEFAGIVPCIVPPATHGRIYKDMMQLLENTYSDQVSPPVRRSPRVAEAHAHATPVTRWAPSDRVSADYRAVHAWLASRGVL